jgi:hypothetical protein
MRSFLLLIILVIAPPAASGEVLKGVVRDSSNTPISGAMVLVHWDSAGSTVGLKSNIGIGEDLNIRTKDDGTFSVDLPPGLYDVFAASPAFTPSCRKVRLQPNDAVEIVFRMDADPLYTAEMGSRVEVLDVFVNVAAGHVPEGKSTPRREISTVEQCEAACAADNQCKAYAFRAARSACYFYSEVYMGGTPASRELGIYSSGLSILPKSGFVSAFKRSSFPPSPIPVQPSK